MSSKENTYPSLGILAIQGDFEAHAHALTQLGARTVLVREPGALEGLDGIVLPGGESTTFLKFLERGGFLERLRQFLHTKPSLSTCAGCILMASEVVHPAQRSLGILDITIERNAYGRQIDSAIFTAPVKLPGGPIEMVYIRAPRILRVGAQVRVLAERDGFPVLIRQGKHLAATFHPELSSDRRIHQLLVRLASHRGPGSSAASRAKGREGRVSG